MPTDGRHCCPKCGAHDYRLQGQFIRDNVVTFEGHYEYTCTLCWHEFRIAWPPPKKERSMFPIKEVSALDMAFGGAGGKLAELLPAYKDLPEEFTRHEGKWHKVMSDWFYRGLKNAKWTPKPGVDTKKALMHIQTVLGSFEPKHEHKEAGVAFLLSEWFEDVTYEVMKGEPCA